MLMTNLKHRCCFTRNHTNNLQKGERRELVSCPQCECCLCLFLNKNILRSQCLCQELYIKFNLFSFIFIYFHNLRTSGLLLLFYFLYFSMSDTSLHLHMNKTKLFEHPTGSAPVASWFSISVFLHIAEWQCAGLGL